jgi:plastocyanin
MNFGSFVNHVRGSVLALTVGAVALALGGAGCADKAAPGGSAAGGSAGGGSVAGGSGGSAAEAASVEIKVLADKYEPAEVRGKPGSTMRLVFRRMTDEGCGQKLSVPALGIKKDLPLDQPVPVDVTFPVTGKLAFTCGMGHFQGSIVVD